METKTIRDLTIIASVFILASLVFYGYFTWFTPGGMETVYKNWDGPAYVIVAKSLYDPAIIDRVNNVRSAITRPSYFSQQYPLYPLLIRLFSGLGFNESMIFVNLLFSLLFLIVCYFLIRHVRPDANALVVTLLLIFYLPRWFVVSHVGSSEGVFLFFHGLFLLLYLRNQIVPSALAACLALLTRPPALFFFAGVMFYGALRKRPFKELFPYFLVPISLVVLYGFFYLRFGDFFIQVREYGYNNLSQWPPFRNFTSPEYYYDIWKEGLFLIYLVYAIALSVVWQRREFFLSIVHAPYFAYLFFVHHPDISRYALPLLPVLAIAFAPALSKKSVYMPLFAFVPIIYLFAISYLNYNVAVLGQ